ncbi:exosortase F system-associated protein [Lutimonas halocynthiae]|uniref:exosortase F system-associated membrane protein n=1 Tax=Lutimonas halocynthiae TaxID=1446477 RepID=UPI0025B31003|nr:exosortase F system-associated protein [Lutimonas halocynthiae]MDN3642122.1 exosortase F system-associated protein [Lutimonas halocynthiae]
MDKKLRIVIILALFFVLVLVRAFELQLFYDPFIEYFKYDYLYDPIPVFSGSKLLTSLIFRYGLNTVISLFIIYIAFENKGFVVFAVKFYMIAFVILSITFFIILKGELAHGYLFAFYIRRFLIHPLFVLLLLPAFYYKQLTTREII